MPIQSSKVADEGTANSARERDECRALVDSLNKVTGCYRHLATGVGGSADCSSLRDELRRTREKSQEVAGLLRSKLTAVLRDKTLSTEERAEMERLWVVFSSNLESFQMDMCKVLELGQGFPLSGTEKPLIQTGMSGGTSEVAARALSVQNLAQDTALNVERLELQELQEHIDKVDEMMENMEMKVNVLRWTVEAKGDAYYSVLSTDASSMALLSEGEEMRRHSRCCDREKCFMSVLFCTVALIAVGLSVCVVNLS
ncbi:regulator of G-protein signaling 9-binding protein-like [Chiloscyllium plagiosum]|uniref:regulator of G-protein signaling 9-binding protein-like n=1 Tax=Chiloscyllium plagiosum TaxID=36176 RepID=UPI001CB851CB|nr:regulator of G-protein signaling 9-binding protein-like [Chiloscyllium plagiosum]